MFSAPPVLRSLGHKLDPGKLAYLTESNDILEEPRALRERLAEDGYLYIRRFFDPELILSARRAIFTPLAQAGEIDPGRNVMDGFVAPDKIAAFAMDVAPKFKDGYGAKTKAGNEGSFRPALAAASPEIRRVVFGPELCGFYASLFGEPIRHFDVIWTRLMGPGHGTPTHCDPGDFLTFRMDLIHGSLDNQSDRLRFSTDTRYQPASEPADERWIGVNPPGHSALGP